MDNITEIPIKFEVIGSLLTDKTPLIKTFRGLATYIDPYLFDGYMLRQIEFTGKIETREDALRLALFFKCHAECLRKKEDQF